MDLTALLEKTVGALGYELVDLELANRGRLMRIFIDKAGGVDVEDCALVSNHLTRLLVVEGVDYDRLEVSSPGLDRPLKHPQDFARFVGERAQVKVRLPLNGRRRFVGKLQNVGEVGIELDVDGELVAIAFSDIDKARLVPNI
ncbi:MAG: ribosome maturation factor RimP [Betaproteobacteria bacterium]|nr:ribosome maturation factor RimP [Betaproteobacteria bacterium]